MLNEHIVTLIVAVFASSGFWAFLTAVTQKPQLTEVLHKVSDVEGMVTTLSSRLDKSTAISSRAHILRFDDELYNKVSHSQEYFLQIYDDIDFYQDYCRKNPDFENGRATDAIRHIKETYNKCREDHSFI